MKKTPFIHRLLIATTLSLSFLLTGCLTTPSTPYEALIPANNEALVYVYRPESVWWRGTPLIVYAGEEKHEPLINNGYFPLHLQPGTIPFKLTRKNTLFSEQNIDATTMTVAAGQTYFLKVEPHPYGAFKLVIMNNKEGKQEANKTQLFKQNK